MQDDLIVGLNDGFGHWLAGFIDGEGCFSITRVYRPHGICWALRFTLKLRSDDRAILEECQRRTGVGNIRETRPKGHTLQVMWVVESRAACQTLADILDRYPLRAKKARDLAVWREALAEWSNGEKGHRYTGRRDWSKIAALRDRMDALRIYEAA